MENEIVWRYLRNAFNEEEGLLLDENGSVLLIGDDYHDQIFTLIEGFIAGYEQASGMRIKAIYEEEAVHPEFSAQE